MIASDAERALELATAYTQQLEKSIVLYAGANHASPRVREALASELGAMPAMGRPWRKQQPGTEVTSALEELVERQLCALFGANWAEARLPSATMANLAVYAAFCGPARPLMATSGAQGGHASCLAGGTPSLLDIDVVEIPFHSEGRTVDEPAAIALLEAKRPGLVLLGTALVLEVEYPRELIAAARTLGVVVAYDASHVAGLIAGRKLDNPFDAGAHIVTASTYKSFGGPPGGVIVGRDVAHAELLRPIVCPNLTSNYDAARVLAISLACSDATDYMAAYADLMVSTADELHRQLLARGLKLAPRGGRGRTHQLFVEIGAEDAAIAAMQALEHCNILSGISRSPASPQVYGLRLGTQAIVRKKYGR
ncbi:MAG: glycine hydroxymethyltransferase, partial [Vulcanimicrobiaceae bacterium]